MHEASDANPAMTQPKYLQAVVPIFDVMSGGVDIGNLLTRMEMQGWVLVSIVPIFGSVLIVWRGEVALPEFVEVGPGEDPDVAETTPIPGSGVGPNGAVGKEG